MINFALKFMKSMDLGYSLFYFEIPHAPNILN